MVFYGWRWWRAEGRRSHACEFLIFCYGEFIETKHRAFEYLKSQRRTAGGRAVHGEGDTQAS